MGVDRLVGTHQVFSRLKSGHQRQGLSVLHIFQSVSHRWGAGHNRPSGYG